jgi:hypothetical protein
MLRTPYESSSLTVGECPLKATIHPLFAAQKSSTSKINFLFCVSYKNRSILHMLRLVVVSVFGVLSQKGTRVMWPFRDTSINYFEGNKHKNTTTEYQWRQSWQACFIIHWISPSHDFWSTCDAISEIKSQRIIIYWNIHGEIAQETGIDYCTGLRLSGQKRPSGSWQIRKKVRQNFTKKLHTAYTELLFLYLGHYLHKLNHTFGSIYLYFFRDAVSTTGCV